MNEELMTQIVNRTPVERLIPLFADLVCILLINGNEDLVREQLHLVLSAKLETRTQLVLRVVERLHSAGIPVAIIDMLFGLEG